MNRKEASRLNHQTETLMRLGFTAEEADKLRRISMTLRRWHERECGDGNGCIERADDGNGAPYWMNAVNGKSYRIADRETGAKKRLAYIVHSRNCRVTQGSNGEGTADLSAYIQTDPRGAALYILRPGDVPWGEDAGSYYSRGICVY